jgi:hypothetical protein
MLSRRQFLHAAGIAIAAAHLPRLTYVHASTPQQFQPLYGRALVTVPVFAAPHQSAALFSHLWSDKVVPIQDTDGAWYRLPQGYAQRELLQPMLTPASHAQTDHAAPFWGEVTGAVALVRAWCAADAPLVTRVGHGGVLYIADRLTLDGVNWYGVADTENGELLGWSPASVWSSAVVENAEQTLTLLIDQQAQQLTAFEHDQPLLTAPVSAAPALVPGTYTVTERKFTITPSPNYLGTPWALAFGANQHLSGAYWHNRFGTISTDSRPVGAAIEVAPALARWLYPRAASVIIS